MRRASRCGKLWSVSSERHMQRGGGRAVVRQAWLVAEVGALLIGFAIILAVGCSGDTGSQPAGSQNSEVSQSAGASLEQTRSRESESTHEATEPGGSQASERGESTHEVAQHGGSVEAIPPNTITDSLLRVDDITYVSYDYGHELKDKDLGPLYAEVNKHNTGSTTQEQTTSNEVPV